MSKEKMFILTTENAKEVTGVHYTTKHTGKMTGMQSLSTSCLNNPYCKTYSQDPAKVCNHCYAQRQMKMYTSMQECLKQNTEILTSRFLSYDEIPLINASMFRFESFGDIQNITQVINYFNICYKNPMVYFALWTKNPSIINQVLLAGYEKPKNVQIVLSSHYLNVVADISEFSFVDKVFTVFDKNYIKEHEIDINCGSKSCLSCGICYRKNEIVYINEKLK